MDFSGGIPNSEEPYPLLPAAHMRDLNLYKKYIGCYLRKIKLHTHINKRPWPG